MSNKEELDEFEKEVLDKIAGMLRDGFTCEDPDCPHCAYDERYVTDGEIEEEAEKQIANEDLSWEVDYAREAFIKGARWARDQYEEINRDNS